MNEQDVAPDPKPEQLEPYDQGYRDGWADIHKSRWPRHHRRQDRNAEYALGYRHGRTDGDEHPDYPVWWPDYARGHLSGSVSRAGETALFSQPAPEAPVVVSVVQLSAGLA